MMAWSDAESTQKSTRSVRYVPPHLRSFNNSGGSSFVDNASSYGPNAELAQYGFRSNRSGGRQSGGNGSNRSGRGHGRVGGGGSGRSGYEIGWGSNLSVNQDVSEVSDKFDDLEVVEDDNNGDGGGINFNAYEDIPVETSGTDIPAPVNGFRDICLGERLNDNIKRCKYVKPTPIQRHAIPIAIAGRDLMACAQTGSGKTAAFCFPIISGILKNIHHSKQSQPRYAQTASPSALILSPTRELAGQIHDEAKKFAYQTGLKIVAAYGGASISNQLRNLERGVDILVATPGRLVDMIERGRVSLRLIKYFTLDEADRMLDMGFEPQIRKIVEKMDMPLPGTRQTMLFSATFPTEIQKLASDFLSNYIFLAVGRVGSSTDLIVQKIDYVEDMDKRNHLMHILHTHMANGTRGKLALTLVFVETKKGADALEYWLSMNGFPAIAIHGDKVQFERERALKSFKSGTTPILVATDVASRGLDIPHVAHVINFDLPREIDDYVHRIGRTGRAGNSGLATAFFNDKNFPLAKALVELMLESSQEVPSWLNQYAESSTSFGRVQRSGGSQFGGYDYRSAPSGGETYQHYSSYGGEESNLDSGTMTSSYDVSTAVPTSGEYYLSADAEPYVAKPYEYGESYDNIVASGWD
ncbi:DEAD-box ATP-dependent RNA helicase 11-like [Humulus lupulus]|uniref:DEAD-box ATP-dependent RNA helicase 11-like n=1 Tax=Humulus lupulus TaxID=3486 RepID=UPI002B417967|nr:DEAD-box ATP-dependent RNA helicase 11-like [Humulus lupulus]